MKFFWNKKLVILIYILIFSFTFSFTLSLESKYSSLIESETEKHLLSNLGEQIYQSSPLPHNISNMLLAYTTIYPDDKVPRTTLDSVSYENGNIVIYRPDADGSATKIIVDLKELSWLCGKTLLCKPDEALEVMKDNPFKKAFKLYIDKIYEKLGPDSTNCIVDEYRFGIIQKAIIICFKNNMKEVQFRNLFSDVKPADMQSISIQEFDKLQTLTHLLYFSDGREALEEKTLTFKNKAAYEGEKILFRYGELENINGKKCQIKYRLPIVPTNFLNKDIYDRSCVARFKYNKIDTYIGSNSKNCENIMKYVITKIKLGCLQAKEGNGNLLKSELRSNPSNGIWRGWVYYHKIIPEEGGQVTRLMHKFNVDSQKGKFVILDKDSHEVKVVEFQMIKWVCNNDGSCTLDEYERYLKQSGEIYGFLPRLYKEINEQWELADLNSCFVIEEKDSNLICPTDNSEEFNLRMALSVGIDSFLMNAPINVIPSANESQEFKCVHVTDTDASFKDYTLIVTDNGIQNKADYSNLVDFLDIKKLNDVECGFEFRDFELAYSLHEFDSQCCTKFQTEYNTHYICIQRKSKCYIEIRQMIQLMRKNCMKLAIVERPERPHINPDDFSATSYKGEVFYSPLGNYKYRGNGKSFKGEIEIGGLQIQFIKEGYPHLTFSLLEVRFLCHGLYICRTDPYLKHQSKYIEGRERTWMENHFTRFFKDNDEIVKEDCAVLITTVADFNVSEGVIVCSKKEIE